MNKFLLRAASAYVTSSSLTLALLSAMGLMHLLLSNAYHLLPGGSTKFPLLTKWLAAFLPEGSILGWPSVAFFFVGLFWLGLEERPSALVLIQRGIIAFISLGVFASAIPLRNVVQTLMTEPEVTLPIEFVDETVWLILCSLPLIAAILKHCQSRSAGVSTSD